MDRIAILKSVELFDGATPDELQSVAAICSERSFSKDETITRQGQPGNELFIVCEGFVEILRGTEDGSRDPRTIVSLGEGQIFGEMALVDRGPRSATVRAASDPTTTLLIHRDDFERICDQDYHLGYVVMRNIAADLSFKLRHQHLTGR